MLITGVSTFKPLATDCDIFLAAVPPYFFTFGNKGFTLIFLTGYEVSKEILVFSFVPSKK